MFNETRLNDGSTITLWSDISEIKNRETINKLLVLKYSKADNNIQKLKKIKEW